MGDAMPITPAVVNWALERAGVLTEALESDRSWFRSKKLQQPSNGGLHYAARFSAGSKVPSLYASAYAARKRM